MPVFCSGQPHRPRTADLSPLAREIFGDVPASLQPVRRYARRSWSDKVFEDHSAVTEAQRIVNAYNYRKRKGHETTPVEQEKYRVAKSLLSAYDRRQKGMRPQHA